MVRGDIVAPMICGVDFIIDSALVEAQLKVKEQTEYVCFMIGSWVSMLDDSPLDECHFKPARLIGRFLKSCLKDLRATVKFCTTLFDKLTSQCAVREDGSTTGEFIPEFKQTPVFREYLYWYRTRCRRTLSYLLSFLVFLKKTQISDDMFEAVALREWHDVERGLTSVKYQKDYILSEILHVILPEPEGEEYFPRHGPGSVSEKGARTVSQKEDILSVDPRLLRMFTYKRADVLRIYLQHIGFRLTVDAISRLGFVRKDLYKYRSICMEPASRMLAQQLIRSMLEDSISSGPGKQWIRLTDQSWNQFLAKFGSETNMIDTIDLSSASDSVAWELVKLNFPAWILPYLAATRSSRVRIPGGDIVPLKKFAPMGSAVCFPVESVLFLAICLKAVWQFDSARNGRVRPFRQVLRSISKEPDLDNLIQPLGIYGDDIAIDYKVGSRALDLLKSYGFKPNLSKSFMLDQAFRESCGRYFMWGEEIVITRNSIWSFKKVNANAYVGLISFANNLGDRGYYRCRSYVINYLRRRWNFIVPFTKDRDAFGIYTSRDVAIDPRARIRRYKPGLSNEKWSSPGISHKNQTKFVVSYVDYQRDEQRVQTVAAVRNDQEIDHYLYMRKSSCPPREDDASRENLGGNSRGSTNALRIRWRWTPI